MNVNEELESMQKEVIMTYFKVQSAFTCWDWEKA